MTSGALEMTWIEYASGRQEDIVSFALSIANRDSSMRGRGVRGMRLGPDENHSVIGPENRKRIATPTTSTENMLIQGRALERTRHWEPYYVVYVLSSAVASCSARVTSIRFKKCSNHFASATADWLVFSRCQAFGWDVHTYIRYVYRYVRTHGKVSRCRPIQIDLGAKTPSGRYILR